MLANELNDNGWKGFLTLGEPFYDKPLSHQSGWGETMYAEPVNAICAFEEPLYAEPAYAISGYDQPLYAEPASIGRGENQPQRSGSPISSFVSPRNNLHENRGDNHHNETGHNDANLAANSPLAGRQSEKYYHGPLNGDIYAKIDKLKTGKTSSLLEEIISEVRVNEAKFPLLAAYVRKHNMI
ncbi:MAG: hypothetical protein ACR5LH_07090 [Sodalis sp. (in: enterobacteria)]